MFLVRHITHVTQSVPKPDTIAIKLTRDIRAHYHRLANGRTPHWRQAYKPCAEDLACGANNTHETNSETGSMLRTYREGVPLCVEALQPCGSGGAQTSQPTAIVAKAAAACTDTSRLQLSDDRCGVTDKKRCKGVRKQMKQSDKTHEKVCQNR